MLDIFFVANIAISLAVLMVALNAQKPLDFSAFPTVLLFATLFRLGLNVASTRVVLVHGHEGESAAGHVIEAFGTFLIGGDYVVGIFVFAILVIINLIVVTKGAGRVSEVSARFTLDALPGKQMAIDADLNAGLITPEEAKARRVEVSTEADFYGSMDGSSKFVKGDAVAGAADPVRQHRRRPDPRPRQPRHVARRRRAQLRPARDRRRAGRAAAVADAVDRRRRDRHPRHLEPRSRRPDRQPVRLGRAPGPRSPASSASSACCRACRISCCCRPPRIAGFAAWKLRQIAKRPPPPAPAAPAPDQSKIGWEEVSDGMQINLDIGYGLVPLVDERRGAPLMGRITGVRRQLSKELGFVVPQVRVRDDINLAPYTYRILVGGVVVGEDQASADEMLALDTGAGRSASCTARRPRTRPSGSTRPGSRRATPMPRRGRAIWWSIRAPSWRRTSTIS